MVTVVSDAHVRSLLPPSFLSSSATVASGSMTGPFLDGKFANCDDGLHIFGGGIPLYDPPTWMMMTNSYRSGDAPP